MASSSVTRPLQILFLTAAVAGLAACGGGGGGDSTTTGNAPPPSGSPSPSPSPSSPPPAPAPTGSGLPPASAPISQSDATAIQLAARVADVFRSAPAGAAAVALGSARPTAGASAIACSGGGSASLSGPATGMTASYANCSVGGYTFNGTATLSETVSGTSLGAYQVDYSGLSVSGPSSFNSALTGRTTCTADGSGGFLCIADYNNIVWGNDFRYDFAKAAANGSTGCECGVGHVINVVSTDLTQTGGSAVLTGASGTAVATRKSSTTFSVVLTAGGTTVTYDPVTVSP